MNKLLLSATIYYSIDQYGIELS